MYPALLTIHSYLRWLVVLTLLLALFRSYRGWLQHRKFTKKDETIRKAVVITAHTQFLVGLCLYFISPLIRYFFIDFEAAKQNRDIRFFGMEHGTMMILAIIFITIGAVSAKRKREDRRKFRTLAIFLSLAFLIIFIMIPWRFSPLVSRPYIRLF